MYVCVFVRAYPECTDIVGCGVAETCSTASNQQCSKCSAGYNLQNGGIDKCVMPAGQPIQLSAARLTMKNDNYGSDQTNAIPKRTLNFVKKSATSLVRVTYADNLRVYGNGKVCTWTIKIDGRDCPVPIYNSKHTTATSDNDHTPHAIVGTCSGIGRGGHTMTIALTRSRHSTRTCQSGMFIISDTHYYDVLMY